MSEPSYDAYLYSCLDRHLRESYSEFEGEVTLHIERGPEELPEYLGTAPLIVPDEWVELTVETESGSPDGLVVEMSTRKGSARVSPPWSIKLRPHEVDYGMELAAEQAEERERDAREYAAEARYERARDEEW